MPIFDFECQACRKIQEQVIYKLDDKPTPCTECGSTNLKKLPSAFATDCSWSFWRTPVAEG